MFGLSAREWAAILGAAAFAGLSWRCISYYTRMTSLERALGGLLIITTLIAAIGSYRLDVINAPASGVITYVIAHRIVCLIVVAFWPRFLGRTGTTRQRLGLERRR